MRPRIRTIKPEFFLHEELFDLEQETGLPVRLAFIGLWCQADREGRFQWRPRTLKAGILPFDDTDFGRVLDALATRGFVVSYTCAGERYGYIPSFTKHQAVNNRESESDLPDPHGDGCEAVSPQTPLPGTGTERNGNGTGTGIAREARDKHASATRPPRVNGKPGFVPPSVQEVQAFATEDGFQIDAERFVDHFASNGWRVGGKTPMKDWQAAARNWARREPQFSGGNGRKGQEPFGRNAAVVQGTVDYFNSKDGDQ